ncbi:MAG: hypothetical protein PHE50_01915 [Dehalococcoidales bacterium]|nr:hypothetical protein [Dehalococcoidales bacterium]
MADELGKIEKPGLEQYRGKRKLYVVPLIYGGEQAPADYIEKYERYWIQVTEQINAQSAKVGAIKRIYHESVATGGKEGIEVIEKMKVLSHRIAREKVDEGAALEALEEMELVDECMDWERCLMIGFFSHKVAETVTKAYRESTAKRYAQISRRIDETLQENEIGVLFIREGHAVQFAPDIDVFMVAPPALDEVHRWLRNRREAKEEADS